MEKEHKDSHALHYSVLFLVKRMHFLDWNYLNLQRKNKLNNNRTIFHLNGKNSELNYETRETLKQHEIDLYLLPKFYYLFFVIFLPSLLP